MSQHQRRQDDYQGCLDKLGQSEQTFRVQLIGEDTAEFERLVGERAAMSERSADAYRQSLNKAVAGTPEQCAEQIQRYVDGGITYFFLLFPDPLTTDQLELFASEVMPRFSTPLR